MNVRGYSMEFIGKKVKVEYVQETGWKRPTKIFIEKKPRKVKDIVSRWEEHTFNDAWWQRKHRVFYVVGLEDGKYYELYWDRGAKGQGTDWILNKEVSDEE